MITMITMLKKNIVLCYEDFLNLKIVFKRLAEISDPMANVEVYTLWHIINQWDKLPEITADRDI